MVINRIFLFLGTIFLLLPLFCGCGVSTAAEQPQSGEFLDQLTFLGDSTTAHLVARSTLRPEQIWATKERYLNLDARITHANVVAPDTGKEERICAVAARLRPRYLVITLGVDYAVYYYRDRQDLLRFYYEKLLNGIKEASPDTVIVIQSVFPVARTCKVLTNEMIQKANGTIAAMARERGLAFVDQTATLSDAQGFLRPEYCSSEDGIHLTAAAYEAILAHLCRLEGEIKQ